MQVRVWNSYMTECVFCACMCVCVNVNVSTQPLIWPLSWWQVENGSAVCHHSWIIHSQQCSMERELRCAHCHAELHGLMITLRGPGSWRFVRFKLVSVHSQLISFRPSPANNLLNTILILFMDLSRTNTTIPLSGGRFSPACPWHKTNKRCDGSWRIKIGCLLPVGIKKKSWKVAEKQWKWNLWHWSGRGEKINLIVELFLNKEKNTSFSDPATEIKPFSNQYGAPVHYKITDHSADLKQLI